MEIVLSETLVEMVKGAAAAKNKPPEAYKMYCVRLAERLLFEMETTQPQSKPLNVWGKKPAKYPGKCSFCSAAIEPGAMVWIIQGQSPRCAKHGNPNLQPYPNDEV